MTMTRDEIMQLDDEGLRLEVAKRSWLDGIIYPINTPNAIALLDSMTYHDGVSVEYNIGKETRYSGGNLLPPGCIVYVVTIWGHNPIHCDVYEATADTLPRAACVAWLMWMDGQHDNS